MKELLLSSTVYIHFAIYSPTYQEKHEGSTLPNYVHKIHIRRPSFCKKRGQPYEEGSQGNVPERVRPVGKHR